MFWRLNSTPLPPHLQDVTWPDSGNGLELTFLNKRKRALIVWGLVNGGDSTLVRGRRKHVHHGSRLVVSICVSHGLICLRLRVYLSKRHFQTLSFHVQAYV